MPVTPMETRCPGRYSPPRFFKDLVFWPAPRGGLWLWVTRVGSRGVRGAPEGAARWPGGPHLLQHPGGGVGSAAGGRCLRPLWTSRPGQVMESDNMMANVAAKLLLLPLGQPFAPSRKDT